MLIEKKKINNPWDQVALNYQDEVISPIYHSLYNPLETALNSIKNKNTKTVGDFGCGTGPLVPLLAESFKRVYALDLSAQMLKLAFEKMQNYPVKALSKVTFHQESLTELEDYKSLFDTIVTVNSVIMPKPQELSKTFNGLHSSLKDKGTFLGVFPALEAIQEEFQHTYSKELKKYKSNDMALAATRKKLEARRINFELGTYNTGDMIQKYFNRVELESYLTKAGFKNIRFDRVVYDRKYSYNYHDTNLKTHPFMWDHFVSCEKSEK